jgi:hypothetical protein
VAVGKKRDFDINRLLYPGEAFSHPDEVLADEDLTQNEKRATLASWASDACAVEAMPELRSASNGSTVKFDDITQALRELDGEVAETPKYRKFIRRALPRRHVRDDGNESQPLHRRPIWKYFASPASSFQPCWHWLRSRSASGRSRSHLQPRSTGRSRI